MASGSRRAALSLENNNNNSNNNCHRRTKVQVKVSQRQLGFAVFRKFLPVPGPEYWLGIAPLLVYPAGRVMPVGLLVKMHGTGTSTAVAFTAFTHQSHRKSTT